MKKSLFFIFFLYLIPTSFCQWHKVNEFGCEECHKIFFVNNEKGFVTGLFEDGSRKYFILKTLDGGVNWDTTKISCPFFSLNATDVFFPNKDTGFFAGYFVNNFSTKNGGISWDEINSNISNPYYDNIYFLNTKIGYGCIKSENCYKTLDGGENWVQEGILNEIRQIQFTSDSSAFALSINSLFVKNQAGNWEEKQISNEGNFNRMSFRNKNFGFAAGKKIARTYDGGDSWDFYTLPDSFSIIDIQMVSDSIGYAATFSFPAKIYKTIDGGNNWYRQEITVPSSFFKSINCPSADTCYAVGRYGEIYKTTNGGGPLIGVGIKENEHLKNMPIFPNPASDIITIPLIIYPSSIKLFDFSGKLLITEQIGSKENQQINISSLPAGLYLVVVENEEGVFREKLVKK